MDPERGDREVEPGQSQRQRADRQRPGRGDHHGGTIARARFQPCVAVRMATE